MSGDDFIKAQCCLLAWRDGHAYSANAMIGILHVIRNAAMGSYYNGNWIAAIQGLMDLPIQDFDFPDVRDPAFQVLLDVVDGVYDGSRTDRLTGGATQYGRPGVGLTRVADIGGLIFYR